MEDYILFLILCNTIANIVLIWLVYKIKQSNKTSNVTENEIYEDTSQEDSTTEIKNDIDWKIIDQLHNATINFSKTSLELKKLLFVVLGISTPIIFSVFDNKLDRFLFIFLGICILMFWLYDSYTYYFQEKLRSSMNNRFTNIAKRNNVKIEANKYFTLPSNRSNNHRLIRSIFNDSNLIFYGIFIVLVVLGYFFYKWT